MKGSNCNIIVEDILTINQQSNELLTNDPQFFFKKMLFGWGRARSTIPRCLDTVRMCDADALINEIQYRTKKNLKVDHYQVNLKSCSYSNYYLSLSKLVDFFCYMQLFYLSLHRTFN